MLGKVSMSLSIHLSANMGHYAHVFNMCHSKSLEVTTSFLFVDIKWGFLYCHILHVLIIQKKDIWGICKMLCCGQCFVVTNVIAITCFAAEYPSQSNIESADWLGSSYQRLQGTLHHDGAVTTEEKGGEDNAVGFFLLSFFQYGGLSPRNHQ